MNYLTSSDGELVIVKQWDKGYPSLPKKRRYLMYQPVLELLTKAEVITLFVRVAAALCVAMTLDSVDKLSEAYRIRSHDSYGPLPDIEIDNTNNIEQVRDRICLGTARLAATVRFRHELATRAHDCQFITPTSIGRATVVGISAEGKTVRARGANTCLAYQKLNRKMIELSLQAARLLRWS